MTFRLRTIVIEVSEDDYGYRAEVKGRPHLYGCGRTYIHAIGDLVLQFPKVFGVLVRRKRPGR